MRHGGCPGGELDLPSLTQRPIEAGLCLEMDAGVFRVSDREFVRKILVGMCGVVLRDWAVGFVRISFRVL